VDCRLLHGLSPPVVLSLLTNHQVSDSLDSLTQLVPARLALDVALSAPNAFDIQH